MSSALVAGIQSVFATGARSDCDVLFYLEPWARARAGEGEEGEAEQRKRPRLAETVPAETVGEPLPAHSLLLSLASDVFRAQVDELWAEGAGRGAETSSSSASHRPRLRVFVNSEAEAAFARTAIGYAYKGQVAAGGVREALEVRRQAGYLQIDGCVAACDELLLGMLTTAEGGGNGQAAAAVPATPAATAVACASSLPAAAELMACWAFLPDPADDLSFAPVLAVAKEALVRHFGDVLAVLNTPSLRQQLRQLPAAAMEALLGSEAFGTDTEDSVLLLLATWMKANHSQADAVTRKRLCRLVRLVQLSRPYLTMVLPALAADYESQADGSPCAWFSVGVVEACFIAALATAPAGQEKKAILRASGQLYDTQSPWFDTRPRSQGLSKEGRTFEWAIHEQELRAELGRREPEDGMEVYGSFAGDDRLYARGFEWDVLCDVKHKAASAGCYLHCALPVAYDVPGSRLGRGNKVAAAVVLDARLAVHSWGGGVRQDAFVHNFSGCFTLCGGWLNGKGSPSALPLAQPQPAGGVEVLVGWATYLRDGRLTGTLTLLPTGRRPALEAVQQ